jgi:transcriptional regulator with XRE-family HTH domain
MRVRCHLREFRGKRSLRDVAEQVGINHGMLSQIERGRVLPRDDQIPALEQVYGEPHERWYPELVLAAIAIGFDDEDVAA